MKLKMKKTNNNQTAYNLALISARGVISSKERAVLDYLLLKNPTEIYPVDVSRNLGIDKIYVYQLLKSLQKKELITENSVNISKISEIGTSIQKYLKTIQHITQEQFESMWINYHKELHRYLLSRGIYREDAEDILQDSYLKAWKNISGFELGSNFRAWIYLIVKNTMKDFLRKKVPFQYDDNRDSHCVNDEEEVPQEAMFGEIEAQEYCSVMYQLPKPYGEIMELLLNNVSYKEIAALHGISMGTAKSRIHRAKELFVKMVIQENQ